METRSDKFKYFSISIIFLVLSRIVAQAFRIVARIIIARYSTSEIFGIFSVIWNEMSLVGLVALIGLGQQLTIDLPRKNKKEKNQMIYSSLFFSLLLCIIIAIVSLILNLINIENTYKYSLIIAVFFVLFLLCQFILIGLKDFFGVFLLFLIQNLSLLLMIVLLRNQLSIDNIVYATAGSIALASVSLLIYIIIKYRYTIKEIKKEELKVFDFSTRRLYLFIVDIVDSVVLYLLVKLPQLFLGSSYAGFVSIAFAIMSFVLILPQIITISLGPLVSEEYINENYEKMHRSFRTSMSLIYLLQGIAVLVFIYFGNPIIELLYGSEYVSGTFYIFYGFLLAVVIDSFTYPFGLYLRNTSHENLFGLGKIVSLFFFVAFEVLLLYLMQDTMAIPIAYIISKIALLAFYLYSAIKHNDRINKIDIRKLLVWLSIIFVSFILTLVINHFFENLLYRALFLILNLALFMLSIALFKIVNLKQLVREIISKISSKSVNKT